MALLLAPYNDSMRLGMGFNSYTQNLCIDNAVQISEPDTSKNVNPSQNVTYSCKFVEHLSEVVSAMQVSHSSSIKRGTVEIAGNGDSINEEKIKSSDVNAVISVKVVNQTLVSGDNAIFKPLPGILPGTSQFNENFGDCYISGFITGGEFNGVVSMRVVDRSKTSKVVAAIKKSSRSVKGAAEFTLDLDTSSGSFINSSTLNDTETTITVSWMGGGQIKEPTAPWTMESVYAAADAFPARVAKQPQRTWAILTKYKANRSFVHQTSKMSFSPLEYDLVAAFTSNLFDNYMDYKSLVKAVQDMMANPTQYKAVVEANAIQINVDTLVAVRSALRMEMNKIVKAVDILTRDPHVLKQSGSQTVASTNKTVQAIIRQSIGGNKTDADDFWAWEPSDEGPSHEPASNAWSVAPDKTAKGKSTPPKATTAKTTKVYREQWVWIDDDGTPLNSKSAPRAVAPRKRPAGFYWAYTEDNARVRAVEQDPPETFDKKTGTWGRIFIEKFNGEAAAGGSWEHGLVESSIEIPIPGGRSDTVEDRQIDGQEDAVASGLQVGKTSAKTDCSNEKPLPKSDKPAKVINFNLLMAPEIWRNVLPKPIDGSVIASGADASKMPISMAGDFPAPPLTDFANNNTNKSKAKLEILTAVCGVLDFTDEIRGLMQNDILVVETVKVKALLSTRDNQPEGSPKPFLAFVYQYAPHPMRACIMPLFDDQAKHTITPDSTEFAVLKPSAWKPDTWSISAICYAGRLFNEENMLSNVLSKLKSNYNGGNGQRSVSINTALLNEKPWQDLKSASVIFYQASENGQMRAAVGIENEIPCLLTDSLTSVSSAQVKASQQSTIDFDRKEAELAQLQRDYADADREHETAVEKLEASLRTANETIKSMREADTDTQAKLTAANKKATTDLATIESIQKDVDKKKTEIESLQARLSKLGTTFLPFKSNGDADCNLDHWWDGVKVQLCNRTAPPVFVDQIGLTMRGEVDKSSWLTIKGVITVTFVIADKDKPNTEWYLKVSKDKALEMRDNVVNSTVFNPAEVSQRWYIGLSRDNPYALCFRTVQHGDNYMMCQMDNKGLVGGGKRNNHNARDGRAQFEWSPCVLDRP